MSGGRMCRPVRSPLGCAILLVAVSSGCGEEAGESPLTQVRDSSGVEIVEFDPPEALALDSAGVVELWRRSAGEDGPFFELVDPRFTGDGRVAVLEASSSSVHLLGGGDGRPLLWMGGPGEGPGEFLRPRGLAVDPDGGVHVVEGARATEFGPDGSLRGEWELGPPAGALPRLAITETGARWVWWDPGLNAPDEDGALRRGMGWLTREPEGATRPDTVALSPGLQFVVGPLVGSPPWGARGVFAGGPDHVWLGDTAHPELRRYGPDGLERILRWPAADLPRSEAHDAEFLDFARESAPPGAPPELIRAAEALLVVETLPEWQSIVVSDAGELWLSTTVGMSLPAQVLGPVAPQSWTVFDTAGTPILRLTTPAGFELEDVREGRLLGIQRTELGEESVRVLELRPGG